MRKKHANPNGSEAPGSGTPETERPGGEPAAPRRATPPAPPSQEDIARRAYEIYIARGGGEGHEIDDWLHAEREPVSQ